MKIFITMLTLLFSLQANAKNDPSVVDSVDLDQYTAEKWYDIAHSPNFFQRKCLSSTAEYSKLSDKSISVFNTCYKRNGKKSTIRGTATILDTSTPAKLQVIFNIIFKPRGDYWITELDPNYQWAVVSGPQKKFTFILSKTAPMAEETKSMIIERLRSKGFDVDHFIFDQYE